TENQKRMSTTPRTRLDTAPLLRLRVPTRSINVPSVLPPRSSPTFRPSGVSAVASAGKALHRFCGGCKGATLSRPLAYVIGSVLPSGNDVGADTIGLPHHEQDQQTRTPAG